MENKNPIAMLTEHYDEVNAELERVAKEKPYALLGAAAAVGFIWGGGMSARFVGSLINLGSRTAISHLAGAWMASNFPVASGNGKMKH